MLIWLIKYWKLLAIFGAVALCVTVGWRVHKAFVDADKADELQRAINEQVREQERTHSIGLDLDHGLNVFRRSNHDEMDSPVYAPDSVRAITDRIAEGEAPRRRFD